jgi:hypothetical protein
MTLRFYIRHVRHVFAKPSLAGKPYQAKLGNERFWNTVDAHWIFDLASQNANHGVENVVMMKIV